MAHNIHAFIAKPDTIVALTRDVPNTVTVALPQDHCLLLLTEQLFKNFEEVTGVHAHEWLEPFDVLPMDFAALAAETSTQGDLMYFETDYHGGDGMQAAVLWRKGEVAVGPIETKAELILAPSPVTALINRLAKLITPTTWPIRRKFFPPREEWAVNQCLREMGIVRSRPLDEFATMDLREYRGDDILIDGARRWCRDLIE